MKEIVCIILCFKLVLLAIAQEPEQSMATLKNMYCNHGKSLWGEYGFKDVVNLEENWHAKIIWD